jgi:hypothetical protein
MDKESNGLAADGFLEGLWLRWRGRPLHPAKICRNHAGMTVWEISGLVEQTAAFSHVADIIHLPYHILSVQAGFSANRKENIEWCNIRAIQWLWHAFESGNI